MSAHETHPNSRKVYVGQYKVPMREISLSGGETPLRVYDTSGPQGHDVREGLPPLRRDWIAARGDTQPSRVPTFPIRSAVPSCRRRSSAPCCAARTT